MNQSVWLEQIDTALKKFVADTIKLDGVPVHSFIRKPEEEFEKTTFPCVTIYNIGTSPHKSREDLAPQIILNGSRANNSLSLVTTPVMFQHIYQFDFWSRYVSQMGEMTYQWFCKVGKDFNLKVKTVSGSDAYIYLIEEGSLRKADLISGKERLLHSFINYTLLADIDTQETEEVPMITTVEVIHEEYT